MEPQLTSLGQFIDHGVKRNLRVRPICISLLTQCDCSISRFYFPLSFLSLSSDLLIQLITSLPVFFFPVGDGQIEEGVSGIELGPARSGREGRDVRELTDRLDLKTAVQAR
uniref:Uncharacterized protein n=1 Tax=Salix viminalis TaxID=40686 RepID=A0A6N2MXV6_SALVM